MQRSTRGWMPFAIYVKCSEKKQIFQIKDALDDSGAFFLYKKLNEKNILVHKISLIVEYGQ